MSLLLRALFAILCLGGGLVAVEAPTPVTAESGAATAPTPAPAPNTVALPPGLVISLSPGDDKKSLSSALTIMLIITALSVAPAFLMMVTSFTRVIIVLGFLRRALGTQTLPPNQIMLGLALFLTIFIMAPTMRRLNDEALQPFMRDEITQSVAISRAEGATRDFMLKHTRKGDLALFIKLAGQERPKSAKDVAFTTLVPAFMTSELKTAFQMGFVIFLPFLVIDLVISAVLMALGMMMLPPTVVSLPFKILLFVLVDGWVLLLQGLVASYA